MSAEKSPEGPTVTPLDERQKKAVLDDLNKRGATFFSWDTLQDWIRRFGSNAKVSEVQETLKKQQSQKKQ